MVGREVFLRESEAFRRACEEVPPWSGWYWTSGASRDAARTWLRHPGFPVELRRQCQQQTKVGGERDAAEDAVHAKAEAAAEADLLADFEEPRLADAEQDAKEETAGEARTTAQDAVQRVLVVPEIVFAESFKVPVACFTVIDSAGRRRRLAPAELSRLQVPCPCPLPVSEVEHPHDPFETAYMVHACDTDELLRTAQRRNGLSMVTWWSMVAPNMGLGLSPGCVAAALAAEKRLRQEAHS